MWLASFRSWLVHKRPIDGEAIFPAVMVSPFLLFCWSLFYADRAWGRIAACAVKSEEPV
jgi:hypothetical protein